MVERALLMPIKIVASASRLLAKVFPYSGIPFAYAGRLCVPGGTPRKLANFLEEP
jgi:hypothetical protein